MTKKSTVLLIVSSCGNKSMVQLIRTLASKDEGKREIITRKTEIGGLVGEGECGEGKRMEAGATCCCHWHRLYYIGMAANRCRYKRRAAVNKYDNGGRSERKRGVCGVRYGIPVYKSDHQKQRPVTVRTSRMSCDARTYTYMHIQSGDTRAMTASSVERVLLSFSFIFPSFAVI